MKEKYGILAEWGRHGSVWADTLGKRSHGLQEGFEMPPGPPGGHILIKNCPTDPKLPNPCFTACLSILYGVGGMGEALYYYFPKVIKRTLPNAPAGNGKA